jgi:hypothetical protein
MSGLAVDRVRVFVGDPFGGRLSVRGRVLSLGHGDSPRLPDHRAIRLAVHTDFDAHGRPDLLMDNSRGFPFADDSFGTILMARGICTCHSSTHTCGGVPVSHEGAVRFLSEVARVLDKTDRQSYAHLAGGYHRIGHEATMALWALAARGVMARHDVTIDLVCRPIQGPGGRRGNAMTAVIIRPRGD